MARKVDNRRRDIEKYLEQRGVSHEYMADIGPGRFNLERSLRNQARLGVPLNDDVVKRYTEAMLQGDVFPPVLAHEYEGSYVILDGNHRLKAYIEAGEPLDAYIVEGPAQVLVLITFEANAKHGLPSSEEDRLHHAMFLMDNGVSEREAATRLGVPRAMLRKSVKLQSADRRADDVGMIRRDWESIHPATRGRLVTITTDEGFRAAAQLVHDAGLGFQDVAQLVQQLNQDRSATRQAKTVEALRNSMSDRIADTAVRGSPRPGKKVMGPRSRLAMTMGQIRALPDPETIVREVPEALHDDLVKQIDEAAAKLYAVRDKLA